MTYVTSQSGFENIYGARLHPTKKAISMGALGVTPVYEKTLPSNLDPAQLTLVTNWIDAAIPMMKDKLPKENYGWGGANKVVSPRILWTLITGDAPTPEETSGAVYKKFKETAYFYPQKAIRWALNGFVSRVFAWPTIANFGVVRPDFSPEFASNAVRYVPAPPWYKPTRFYWGLVEEVQADGFFRNTQHEGADGSIYLVAWTPARFWWKVPDGAIPNTNSTAGGALIKSVTNWAFNRAGAEWMFPPLVWEKIAQVSQDRWKLNKWAESGNLRLEFHQRRGMPYQGAGSNDPAGWFPYPIIRKQGYDIIVDKLPSAQDYQGWVDWYNNLPIMADPRNKLVVRVAVVNAVTGQAIKKKEGQEKTLIALIEWRDTTTKEQKEKIARDLGLVDVVIPEVETDSAVDAFGVLSTLTEEQLDNLIMSHELAASTIDNLAVHPVLSEIMEEAVWAAVPTKTIVKIYGPVKDKKEPSFMKQYGIYVAAALIVGAVAIAVISSAGATGAAAGAVGVEGAAGAGAIGAGATTAGAGAAGAGAALTPVVAPGVAGPGLLASAAKAITGPALKLGIAAASGQEVTADMAMTAIGGAIVRDVVPLVATEILPDGTVQFTKDARNFIDSVLPEAAQDLAEKVIKGEISRELAERMVGEIEEKGYSTLITDPKLNPHTEDIIGRRVLQAGFPVQPLLWGGVALGGLLLLSKFVGKKK